MRLIDADALKKCLMEMEIFMPYGGDGSVMAVPEISIDHAPTIDAEPVRHGRWMDKGSLSCRCSECGGKNTRESAYCPNCGAKMDLT